MTSVIQQKFTWAYTQFKKIYTLKRKSKNRSSFVFPLWTREEEEKKKRGTERGIITVWPKSRNLELTEERKKRKTSEPMRVVFFSYFFKEKNIRRPCGRLNREDRHLFMGFLYLFETSFFFSSKSQMRSIAAHVSYSYICVPCI